jgi:hypothetical protein
MSSDDQTLTLFEPMSVSEFAEFMKEAKEAYDKGQEDNE